MTEQATIVNQEPKAPVTIIDYMKGPKAKARLQQALGKKADVEEFLSNTLMEISKTPKLQQCSFESVLQCAIDSANFGLIPNKQLGHAYLIPYENSFKDDQGVWKKKLECQLQIGYKGYLKKLAEYNMTVEVEIVTHEEVAEGRFEEIRGSKSCIIHRPLRVGVRKPESIALAYAIGKCAGREDIIAVMSMDEIKEAAKSERYDKELKKKVKDLKGVWTQNTRETDFGEMCKKTVIRRLAKLSSIDVVNKMSSYEGEKEGVIKDITPSDNTHLKVAFLNRNDSSTEAPQNALDELLTGELIEVEPQ